MEDKGKTPSRGEVAGSLSSSRYSGVCGMCVWGGGGVCGDGGVCWMCVWGGGVCGMCVCVEVEVCVLHLK